MPESRLAFSGFAKELQLTDTELIRAIRLMVAAEYEATQLNMQLAEATENEIAIKIHKDMTDGERAHAGEL